MTIRFAWGDPIVNAGKLVVFEGGDGSGKSTQLRLLSERLRAAGRTCLETRQPTDWYRQQPIVREFLTNGGTSKQARILSLLAAADRLMHCQNVVVPGLKSHDFVLCDRYVYSSLVYFEFRGIDSAFVTDLNAGIPKPDVAVFLDAPADVLMARLAARDGNQLKFEEQTLGRIEAIRHGYLRLADHLFPTDAAPPVHQVAEAVARLTKLHATKSI